MNAKTATKYGIQPGAVVRTTDGRCWDSEPATMRFEIEHPLFDSDCRELSDGGYVVEITGKLFVTASSASAELVRLRGYRLRGASEALFMADAHSQELEGYASAMLDENGCFLESVEKLYGSNASTSGCDLLIIDTIAVVTPYRGKRVGLAAALRFIDLFGGGCGYVVIRPHPLVDPGTSNAKKTKSQRAETKLAIQGLAKYWSRLGFKRLSKTSEFMCLNLSMRLPTFDEACE